jgi:hypothetical protein
VTGNQDFRFIINFKHISRLLDKRHKRKNKKQIYTTLKYRLIRIVNART